VISSQVESPDDSEITDNKENPDSIRFNLNGIESSRLRGWLARHAGYQKELTRVNHSGFLRRIDYVSPETFAGPGDYGDQNRERI
jgi:hypothetical protein